MQHIVSCFIMTTSGVERTAMPHSNSSMRKLQQGDSVVLCRQVTINGYRAQCDRTAFLGGVSQDQSKYASLVLAAHDAAINLIQPGVPASKIDMAIRDVFERAGVVKYFVHRSGSGVGISAPEVPIISFDSKDYLQDNMVVIVQPALYIPGIGGFRYTDTVIVKENGSELITSYPRDIKSITL